MHDNSPTCEHIEFEANVDVVKLDDGLVAEVMVRCAGCKKSFGFNHPDIGLLPDKATVSPDRRELRVPLFET